MSIKLIFTVFLWVLAINHTFGQIIADFSFDDTSDMPASLLVNSVGENATGINPLARSDGEGVYTLIDQQNPHSDQWLNLQVPEGLLNHMNTVQLEFDYRCQEKFAWMINAGNGLFRFGHHELGGGLHVRYATSADPTKMIESDYVGRIPRGERSVLVFAYHHEPGIAYIIKDNRILWETPPADRTPGAKLVWTTEEGSFVVGSHMHGDGTTTPSLYRFRVYESLCLDVRPPTAKNDTLCGSGQGLLSASGGQEGQYRWFKGQGEEFTLIEGEVNSTYKTPTLSNTEDYYISIATEDCESPLVPVQTIVKPIPTAPQVNYTAPCGPGETILYIENPQQDHEYYWSTKEGAEVIHQGSDLPVRLENDSIIYVSSSNGICESEPVAIKLHLQELPTIDAGIDPTILKGESVDLHAKGNFLHLHWQEHESLQYPDSPTPKVTPNATRSYVVTAIGANGCENTDTITVYVMDRFPVPNAFSPNSDGRHDTWKIPNIEKYPDCQLLIFNRWGNQVFSSQGYSQPWDGTHQGQVLPAGTYYYTLFLDNETDPVKGSVVIIR